MMKYKNFFLRSLREALGYKFLFIPTRKSFLKSIKDMCLEFFVPDKISSTAMHVVNELIEEKVLAPQTLPYYYFDFGDIKMYDFYIKNYDGRTYSRGFSFDINEALAKALGEVFERQYTEVPKNVSPIFLSIGEMERIGYKYIHPNQYPQPSKIQKETYPLFNYSEDTTFGWVKAKSLLSNDEVYLLAQDAYWGFANIQEEPRMVNQGTNGCGAGYTYEQALNSALLELLQRDIFFRYWYYKKSPKVIDLTTLPKGTHLFMFVQRLRKESFDVYLLDMTEEGVPTVVAIIQRPGTGWFLGGGAAFSKEKAAFRSLEEAFSIYMWTFEQIKTGGYQIQDFITTPPKENFTDDRIDSKARCLLWGSKFFSEKQDKFLILGEKIFFKEEMLEKEFNIVKFMTTKFGDGFIFESRHEIMEKYDFFSLKVSFPNMYSLILIEKYSRPVLNGSYPQNIGIHPFP